MGTAQSLVRPGTDAKVHRENLHQGVAASLGQMQGNSVDPKTLIPEDQKHFDHPLQQILNPDTEADIEDIMAGIKGKPRTEPSKNFLKAFLGRLRKKNPDAGIGEGK